MISFKLLDFIICVIIAYFVNYNIWKGNQEYDKLNYSLSKILIRRDNKR